MSLNRRDFLRTTTIAAVAPISSRPATQRLVSQRLSTNGHPVTVQTMPTLGRAHVNRTHPPRILDGTPVGLPSAIRPPSGGRHASRPRGCSNPARCGRAVTLEASAR